MHKCYQAIPSEVISEEDWLILTLTMIMFRLVKDVTYLRQNAFTTPASSNKTVSAFVGSAVIAPLNLLIMHDK